MSKRSPAVSHFDLLVIGSGPAGLRAALQAAKAGKQAVIIERFTQVGGGCVHFGTLPSKSFRDSVHRFSMSSSGVLGKIPDMRRLLQRKERVVEDETQVIRDQLKRNGVLVVTGDARLISNTQVEVTAKKKKTVRTGEKIIIAVGARPVAPPHLLVDGTFIFDSDTVLDLKKVPKSMVVLGAGVIGCEYASMFAMAGTKVTLIDKRDRILGSVDTEIVRALRDRFEFQGMKIVLGTEAAKYETKKGPKNKDVIVHF